MTTTGHVTWLRICATIEHEFEAITSAPCLRWPMVNLHHLKVRLAAHWSPVFNDTKLVSLLIGHNYRLFGAIQTVSKINQLFRKPHTIGFRSSSSAGLTSLFFDCCAMGWFRPKANMASCLLVFCHVFRKGHLILTHLLDV